MDARATRRIEECDSMVPTLHDALLLSDAYDKETSGALHSVSKAPCSVTGCHVCFTVKKGMHETTPCRLASAKPS